MVIKYFEGTLPEEHDSSVEDNELVEMVNSLHKVYESNMEKYAFQNAIVEVLNVTSRANKYIDETTPWVLAKEDDKKPRLAAVMYNLLEAIRICTVLLQPMIPDACEKIFSQIGATTELTTYESATAFGGLPKTVTVSKGEIIFPRLDLAKELEELAEA
jgi:methionyl-tRNA synthetase